MVMLRSIDLGSCEITHYQSRSARWTSGSPRMVLVLVRQFESRRGEILNLFANKKMKKDQLLRAPSVGAHFDASRRGKKELKSSRDKNARHEP